MNQDQELWRIASEARHTVCVMRSCCSGAELQVIEEGSIVLRELYPMKSDLYERARALEAQYRACGRDASFAARA